MRTNNTPDGLPWLGSGGVSVNNRGKGLNPNRGKHYLSMRRRKSEYLIDLKYPQNNI
ncbi:MAG: hypothetical protein HYY84_11890 [Deltaproteobacteria bacterium]|nr:hypothetical protein [Deltaproteobacteria bacterium]